MARYVKGDLVLTPFPFSDEEEFKVRPALVLAILSYGISTDYLVCIVTTQPALDPHLLTLTNSDIDGGSLSQNCYLRPGYVYTVGQTSIKRRLGTLKPEKREQVTQAQEIMDQQKREQLIVTIKQWGLPGSATGLPLVLLEDFFVGNDDISSIGCNLIDPPGPQAFFQTLQTSRARPNVQDVLVEIMEVEEEEPTMWPFSERVYIFA